MAIDISRLVQNVTAILKQRGFPRKANPKIDTDLTCEVGDGLFLQVHLGSEIVQFETALELRHIYPRIANLDVRAIWTDPEAYESVFRMYVAAINDEVAKLQFTLDVVEVAQLEEALQNQALTNIRDLAQARFELKMESPNGVYNSCSSGGVLLADVGLKTAEIHQLWKNSEGGQGVVFRQYT